MKKNIIKLFAVCSIIGMVLCGCTNLSTPESTFKTYTDALKEGDVDTLIACKPPKDQKTNELFKGLGQGLTSFLTGGAVGSDTYDSLTGLMLIEAYGDCDYEITGSEIAGNSAYVYFDFYKGGVYQSSEYMPLIKENGKWYIYYTGYYQW